MRAVPKDRVCANLPIANPSPASIACNSPILSWVEVIRNGRVERFLHAHPTLLSSLVRWAGVAVQNYSVPACVVQRHEHLENFVHVVLRVCDSHRVTGPKFKVFLST